MVLDIISMVISSVSVLLSACTFAYVYNRSQLKDNQITEIDIISDIKNGNESDKNYSELHVAFSNQEDITSGSMGLKYGKHHDNKQTLTESSGISEENQNFKDALNNNNKSDAATAKSRKEVTEKAIDAFTKMVLLAHTPNVHDIAEEKAPIGLLKDVDID